MFLKHPKFCTLALLTALLVAFGATPALAANSYRALITAQLCPESKLFNGLPAQNHTYSVKYRIGDSADVYTARILSQEISQANNSGTFEVELPSWPGTTQLQVYLECDNGLGASGPSNEKPISHCDALSISDGDGDALSDVLEDSNCDGFYNIGDFSNPEQLDSDGDGVFDITELFSGTLASFAGSSPRPFIIKGSAADFNDDGRSDATVWRAPLGLWFIRNFFGAGVHLNVQWGRAGDAPFVYQSPGRPSNVGVVRRTSAGEYQWLFRPPGLEAAAGGPLTTLTFGSYGDLILLGPWQRPDSSNPAIARLVNGLWVFTVVQLNGEVRSQVWGVAGDIPKVQDYDGDGRFDVAVFRPSEGKTYILRSSDGNAAVIEFGTGTADATVRGDYTGDGRGDIVFWEPINGTFLVRPTDRTPEFEVQLGLFSIHLPLSYNRFNGREFFTVVDHATGLRYWRKNNRPNGEIEVLQWGLPGIDFQG